MTDPTTIGPVTEDIGTLRNNDAGWRIVQHESVRVVSYDIEGGDRAHSLQMLGTDGEWHEVQWSPSAESMCGHLGLLGGHADQLRKKWCPDHDDIGVRLRRQRREADMSQREVAETLDVSIDTIRSWESGRRSPSGLYRRRLEEWLDA